MIRLSCFSIHSTISSQCGLFNLVLCTVDSVITHTPRDRPRGMAYGRVWVLMRVEALKMNFGKWKIVCVFTEYGLYVVWVITEPTVLLLCISNILSHLRATEAEMMSTVPHRNPP